jgi:hypothetical protein
MAISIPELPNITTLLGGDLLHLISANTDYNIDISDFFGNIPVNVDITGTLTSSGKFTVSSGGAEIVGTSGNTTIEPAGNQINMSRNSANYLRAETTDGYLSFITNGRSIAVDNSNLVLNADKTSEFKGKLTVSSGGATITGSSGSTIEIATTDPNIARISAQSNSVLSGFQFQETGGATTNMFRWLDSTGATRMTLSNAGALSIDSKLTVSSGGIDVTGQCLTGKNSTDDGKVQLDSTVGSGGFVNVYDSSNSIASRLRSYEISNVMGYVNGGFVIGGTSMTADYDLEVKGSSNFLGKLTVSSGGALLVGEVTVGDGAGQETFSINGGAGSQRQVRFLTNALQRFIISTNTTAESGSNAGSNLSIFRYNDAGTFLGECVTIERSSGEMTLSDKLTVSSGGIDVTGTLTTTGTGLIQVGTSGSIQPTLSRSLTSGGLVIDNIGSTGTATISFRTDGSEKVSIANNGKLTVSSGGLTVSAGMTDLGASGGLDVATNSRSLHGDYSESQVFDALDAFVPTTNDEILLNGALGPNNNVSKAVRVSSTRIDIYYVNNTSGTAISQVDDGGAAIYNNTSISW